MKTDDEEIPVDVRHLARRTTEPYLGREPRRRDRQNRPTDRARRRPADARIIARRVLPGLDDYTVREA